MDYDDDLDLHFVAQEELLATADIVIINVRLSKNTSALINK